MSKLAQQTSLDCRLKWNLLEVSVEQGDITRAIADAFIIPCDKNLECSNGVTRAVLQAGGSLLLDTVAICALETPGLQHSQLVTLPGGCNLDTWYVLMVCPRRNSVDDLVECYKRALETADQLNLSTIALTAFGTGRMKTPANDSALAAFRAIFDSGMHFKTVQSIRIIDINTDVVNSFRSCMIIRAKELPDAVLLCGYHNNSEVVETKSEDDVRKSVDHFFRVIPSPTGNKIGKVETDDVCAICYDTLFGSNEGHVVVQLQKCGHVFHRDCLKEAFSKVQVRCPICKRWYSVPKGNQPSGSTMTVTKYDGSVPGFPDANGYFCIEYNLPGGIQTDEHPRPGFRYSGVRRYAYLPNTCEGQKILKLFKLAFSNRLMFTIGDCESGRRNVVIFNGIQNKSSLKGGPKNYGFPDPEYCDRVKRELAAVGITEQLLETLSDY